MGKVDFELAGKLATGRTRAGELGREVIELETTVRGLAAELASATAAATEETEIALIENRKPEARALAAVEPILARLKASKAQLETMKGAALRQRGIVDDLQNREADQRQQAALGLALPIFNQIRPLIAQTRDLVVQFNRACDGQLSVGDFMRLDADDMGISYDLSVVRELNGQIAELNRSYVGWEPVLGMKRVA